MTNGLFDGHPDLLTLPGESQYLKIAPRIRMFRSDPDQYFLHMMGRPFDRTAGKKLPFRTPIDRELNWKVYEPWQAILDASADPGADEARMLQAIRNGKSEGELFLELVAIYRERVEPENRATTILEKTPGNEFMAERMLRTFPKVKFLHLVRDPFDNLRSRVARHGEIHWGKVNWPGVVNMSFEWLRSLHAGARIYRAHPDCHRMVRYEDLVSQPENVLKGICAFLDIQFNPNLLHPTKKGSVQAAHTGSQEAKTSEEDLTQITPEGLRKDAVTVLGEAHCRGVAACLGGAYAAMGYDKYRSYFSSKRLPYLLKRYPRESLFQYGLRFLLDRYFAMQPALPNGMGAIEGRAPSCPPNEVQSSPMVLSGDGVNPS